MSRLKEQKIARHNAVDDTLWLARLEKDAETLAQECQAVMDTIDWEQNATDITQQIPFKKSFTLLSGGAVRFTWYRAAAAVFLVFSLGIAAGYLLFRAPAAPIARIVVQNEPGVKVSLARMENNMAKREIIQYFQQSQMVLTDLLESCDTRSAFSWKNHLDMKRVQTLLTKSRYFSQDLKNPNNHDLLSSKELVRKIEWLLFEILMNENEGSCIKLQKLQDYIRQERLLFKIHLAGKELLTSEV